MWKRMLIKNKKNRSVFINFFWGFLAGTILGGTLILVYQWGKTPYDLRQLCIIKGYENLNQDQIEDIRMLSGIYETGYVNQWLSGIEINEMTPEELIVTCSVEKKEVEFRDLRNAKFEGKDYKGVEICLNDRTEYEKRAGVPEMVKKIFGTRDVVEIRYERKDEEEFFLVIMSAGGDVFFVPPQEIRSKEGGEYWLVYPLCDGKEVSVK